MGGRVKTLHPKLYAGVLALRDDPAHMAAAQRARDRVRRPRVREPVPVRGVGGPPRRDRARGARAHRHRRPDDDPRRGQELRLHGRRRSSPRATTPCCRSCATATASCRCTTRESLAAEAFAYTARYDTAISRWFAEKQGDFPELMMSAYEKVTDLSYGENPHQRAAYYSQVGARMHVLSQVRQLGGKELSFNNVLDINAGRLLVQRVRGPGVRDHQAQQPVRGGGRRLRRSRPTGARSRATRCRRSAASSASTGRSTRELAAGAARAVRARSCSRPSFTDDAVDVLVDQAEPAHPRGRRAPARRTSPSGTSSA